MGPARSWIFVSRPEVVIRPLSIDGTTPFGFLSHLQNRRIPAEGLTREFLIEPLAKRMPRTAFELLFEFPGLPRISDTLMMRSRPLTQKELIRIVTGEMGG